MSDLKLCFGCMEPLGDDSVCVHCGYDQNTTWLANYLKPGTVLHERFMVGKVLSANGEGVTYVGYDESVECKVLIREYFPERLCSRVTATGAVNVKYDHLAQYKALMAEYTEMNKALARMRDLSHLNPALDMFAENNTTYAVYEYLEGGTLLEYLKENAGELSWNIVRRIFPPLFTTLSLLHNAGVLHRGLSPETIWVTDKGEIKLTGFCISAVRTNDTELDAELFDGYAAPEQYFADRQQGTWTDVYGICAVLYRILTGCRATDAISRQDYDILVPPAELNPQVPESVSNGIMQGLELDGSKRVRTITDLVTLLFGDVNEESDAAHKKENTAVFEPQHGSAAPRRTHPANRSGQQRRPQQGGRSVNRSGGQRRPAGSGQYAQQRRSPNGGYTRNRKEEEISIFERVRAPLLIAFLFVCIITIIVIGIIHIMNMRDDSDTANTRDRNSSVVDNVEPAEGENSEEELHPDSIVPDLVGKNYQIKRDEMAGWLDLDPIFEFNENVLKDNIFWQEFEVCSDFVSGSTMKVKVSLGTSILVLPDFSGERLQSYVKKLEEMGFVAAVDGGNDSSVNFNNNNVNGMTTTRRNDDGSVVTTTNENGKEQHVIYKAKVDYNYSNGFVCAVDPPPMTVIDALGDYTITVYYAYNPVNDTYVYTQSSYNGTTNRARTTTKTTTTGSRTTTTRPVVETEAPRTEAPSTEPPVQTAPPATDPPVSPPVTNAPTPTPDPPSDPTPTPTPTPDTPSDPGGGEEAT